MMLASKDVYPIRRDLYVIFGRRLALGDTKARDAAVSDIGRPIKASIKDFSHELADESLPGSD